ncbi:YtzI protein [Virgibacillus soli]|uniref:YtzI protein n=1 Tax=Paracerasibacillus soli TaxID=480284 RepID=A0ABU5CVJ2_9BACI|nr:YtzI protein [Virgibacillus soli]MDY0410402.1 YtzI protein [Virgibacillus soli]
MVYYVIAMVAICVIVLIMSLVTVSKGYAYKHVVDPLPENEGTNNKVEGIGKK